MTHASRCTALCLVALAIESAGCDQRLDVGSSVIWTALYEGNNFDEWTGAACGDVSAMSPDVAEISTEHPHRGRFSAKLTIDAGSDGVQQNVGLTQKGALPQAAYYSAWYYLPNTVDVGDFWVIFKFRRRAVIDDPTSEGELFDLDLTQAPGGEMTLLRSCRWAPGSRSRPTIATPPTARAASPPGWTAGNSSTCRDRRPARRRGSNGTWSTSARR
jgi:hypothetical protein